MASVTFLPSAFYNSLSKSTKSLSGDACIPESVEDDSGLLGCAAVQPDRHLPTFQMNCSPHVQDITLQKTQSNILMS